MIRESLIRLRGELEKELKGNILSFWMKHLPDEEHGGFHGHVTHDNRVWEQAPRGAVQNARILWTFSAAYRAYGDRAYLRMADRAYTYILGHFMDHEWGILGTGCTGEGYLGQEADLRHCVHGLCPDRIPPGHR
jgi:mannose/cellobiose epimerase-like protein (N-acyl-D-glucosamine 2-epimerase family)